MAKQDKGNRVDKSIDFKEVEKEFQELGTNAKTTLLYRLLKKGGPMIWRSCIRYCCQFLDNFNKNMDETDPLHRKYLNYGKNKRKN